MLFSDTANLKLKAAFELYSECYCETLPKELQTISFSEAFEKKMQKLLTLQKKSYFYVINTAAKRVAILILALLVTLTASTFGVKAIGKAVKDFFVETFTAHTDTNSSDTPTSDEENISENSSVSSEISEITQSDNTSKPATPELPTIDVDKSRAPSNDVASAFDEGYIYYQSAENDYGFSTSLRRKKLDGGSEEIVISDYCPESYSAINGKLYYLKDGYIYRCNGDGSNLERYNTSNKITSFRIAGDWIFAISIFNEDSNYTSISELCIIKTDGSDSRKLLPNDTDYKSLKLTLCGFNRGYLYYRYQCRYFESSYTYQTKTFEYRIDYRSSNPQPEELDFDITFSVGSEENIKFDPITNSISYDTIKQGNYYLSIENKKGITITDYLSEYTFRNKLKDYLVFSLYNKPDNNYKIMFLDINGNKKEVVIPFPEDHSNDCYCGTSVYDPNSNYITAYFFDYELQHRILYLISPDGIVSEIYNKLN